MLFSFLLFLLFLYQIISSQEEPQMTNPFYSTEAQIQCKNIFLSRYLRSICSEMSLLQLQLNSHALRARSRSHQNNLRMRYITKPNKTLHSSKHLSFVKLRTKVRAVGTVPEKDSETTEPEEPPYVGFAFVSSVLLPDGTPDVHYRSACGGQKLRDIMMDSNIDLYGPYARALLNCGGGGTCGTCMVEVLDGSELLSPRTDKEKEKLKRKPRNWRLACQTTVGTPDSTGAVVIQQLPEWKGHEWKYDKTTPEEELESS